MILILTIILFIIYLIYSIKPSKSEEYTLEGLKLSWANKASIEGIVTKWIVTLKDSSGSVIHSYENSDAGNLKDFTDVSMNIVDKKEFDEKIIGDNTLELYYNETKDSNKLYTKTVTFTRDDFGMSLDTSNIEEIDIPEPETFTYELIMNKKNHILGIHIEYIKLDGVLATKAQTTIHKNPNRNNKPDNMFSIGSGTENYSSWNANGHNEGDKIFTIVSDKKVDKIDIVYTRPRYAPGWIIKENGVTKITETSNRGGNTEPRPVVYTYDIKNGKSTPSTIPHQTARPTDGWCGHDNSVHQDVPGCGRICSDVNAVGSKNKNTWGSWDKYPGSVDCPAAKLDEVYQFLNSKRSLRVGKVSEPIEPSLSLRAGNSGAQADGGGKVYYLDRHNIDCGSDALNQFGLIRQSGGKTQYNFSCLKPLNLQTKGAYTSSQYKGGRSGRRSSALYLDRHDLNCHDKPITQFALKRSGTRRIKYEYKCGNVASSDVTCRNTSTPWNQESSSVHYLDRHNVKCNSDEYISKFKLNRDGKGKWRYDFKCCKKK